MQVPIVGSAAHVRWTVQSVNLVPSRRVSSLTTCVGCSGDITITSAADLAQVTDCATHTSTLAVSAATFTVTGPSDPYRLSLGNLRVTGDFVIDSIAAVDTQGNDASLVVDASTLRSADWLSIVNIGILNSTKTQHYDFSSVEDLNALFSGNLANPTFDFFSLAYVEDMRIEMTPIARYPDPLNVPLDFLATVVNLLNIENLETANICMVATPDKNASLGFIGNAPGMHVTLDGALGAIAAEIHGCGDFRTEDIVNSTELIFRDNSFETLN